MPRLLLALLACCLLASACAPDDDVVAVGGGGGGLPDPLRVGLIPNIAPDEQRARYQPFGDHLAEVLGVDVELFVAADYAGVVTALASERLDVAYLGGLTYLQAHEQVPVTPLVTEVDRETGTAEYVSAIVVRADSPLESLDDLLAAEGSVAFGDVSSTSGSLYPRVMLVEAGADCAADDLESCPPLSAVAFTGGHDAVAQAVHAGRVDAGGLERRIWHRLEREGAIPEGALRPLAETEVMGYPWVAREALGDDAHEAITEAFLAVDDPALLDLLRAESYVRVEAADYEPMRAHAVELGLLEVGP